MPLETHRIIQNEKLLPGITKVLQISEDFPQLKISPTDIAQLKAHDVSILNQMQQVFVYEEPTETQNSAENGTLNLLKTLPEGSMVFARDLHSIRKEFI